MIHRASFIAAAGASRTGRSFTLIGAARGTSDVQVRGTIVTCPSANSIHTASGPNLRNTSTGSPHRGWIVKVSCTADGVDAEEAHVAEVWKCTLPQSVERFGGLVNLNVHFHLLVPDGVFTPTDDDGLAFARLPAPTGTDLLAILDRVIRRIADEAGDYDAAGDPDPCLDVFAQIPGRSSAAPLSSALPIVVTLSSDLVTTLFAIVSIGRHAPRTPGVMAA